MKPPRNVDLTTCSQHLFQSWSVLLPRAREETLVHALVPRERRAYRGRSHNFRENAARIEAEVGLSVPFSSHCLCYEILDEQSRHSLDVRKLCASLKLHSRCSYMNSAHDSPRERERRAL